MRRHPGSRDPNRAQDEEVVDADAGYGTLAIIDGTTGNDTLSGTADADTLTGGQGNDTLLGMGGEDLAVFSGALSQYRFGVQYGALVVQALTGSDGIDTLHSVETLRFAGDVELRPAAGGEFRVNTTAANYQYEPSIGVLANGAGYVVAWTSYAQDGQYGGIYAQRFDASGQSVGLEFRVNTFTTEQQDQPVVVGLRNGNFAVVWESFGQDGSSDGVFARVFDAGGTALGAEFQVSTQTTGAQYGPAAVALAGGGFVVSWTQAGDGADVYARRFSNAGVAQGAAEFLVNTGHTTSTQYQPAMAPLAGGGYVVVWSSLLQDGDDYGVYGQRFDATGNTVGAMFRASGATIDRQYNPAVASLADGGFVVVWESEGQDGSGYGIYAQRYLANGTAAGGEFRVNTTQAGSQYGPAVTGLADGGFVVGWYGYQVGSGDAVFARRYDASGTALGGEFLLGATDIGGAPALAALGSGFVAAWQQYDGQSDGIIGRHFDASGAGAALRIEGTAGNDTIDIGGPGELVAVGLGGDDTYVVNSAGDVVIEQAGGGIDTVVTSVNWTLGTGIEHLRWDNYNFYPYSYVEQPQITGNGLPNHLSVAPHYYNHGVVLAGLGGNDTLEGANGIDIASYATSPSAVSVDLSAATPLATGGHGTDTLISIEGVIGSAFADTLVGDAGANAFDGGAGNDTLTGNGGNDTLDGGAGTDTAIFSGAVSGYRFGWSANGYLVLEDRDTTDGSDGTDYVRNVELLDLFDRDLASVTGGETRVNTQVQQEQSQARIVRLADGSYVVTWQSWLQDGSGYGVYLQRFAADGRALDTEKQLNTTTAADQFDPEIAVFDADHGGGYVVVWVSEAQDGDGYGVIAQRFGAGGARLGPEIQVNTTALYDQHEAVVATLEGGGFVVAWEAELQDGSGDGVYMRRFGTNGAALGGEVRVNQSTLNDQRAPAVTALPGGGFVIAWQSWAQDGSGEGIFAQRFNAAGAAVGAEIAVNTVTVSDQLNPRVVAFADGSVLVVWETWVPATGTNELHGQRIAANGSRIGAEFRIGAIDDSGYYDPAAAVLADGGFVVVWSGYRNGGYGVYAQRFAPDGSERGEVLQINSSSTGTYRAQSSVTALPDGGFIVAWEANQDGSGDGIYTQRVDADGVLQLIELRGTAGDDRLDIAGPGALQARGLAGDDTYLVDHAGDRVLESANQGHDTVITSISWTLGAYFEDLRWDPGNYYHFAADRTLFLTGNAAANNISVADHYYAFGITLAGLGGNDTLTGSNGLDLASYATSPSAITADLSLPAAQVQGGHGTDTLFGIEGIIGSDFADAIGGDAQANVLEGGAGSDTLRGGAGNDTLDGGAGKDLVVLPGAFSDYRFGWSNGYLSIEDLDDSDGDDGVDLLRNVETVRFADRDIQLRDGGETRVNTHVAGDQFDPAIATLAGGGFVVVWNSYNQDGSWSGVYAQRYNATGVVAGAEFRVNTTTWDDQSEPVIAALAGGGFVVAWTADVGDGSGRGVFAQRFSATGVAQGAEFRINSTTASAQQAPSIAALGSGFVVSWESWNQDGSGYGVYAQRFGANGAALGGEIQVNTSTTSDQLSSRVVALEGGGFVVVWTGYASTETDGYGIYLQRFDANGNRSGADEVRVNTTAAGDQSAPAVAALPGGGYVVTWVSEDQDGSGTGIFAQRFLAGGAKAGPEVRVNTYTVDAQVAPAITALADGYLVTWQSWGQDGSGAGIYAQRYNLSGVAQGAEFRINSRTADSQYAPAVSALPDGGFVVTWYAYGQDGSGAGVFLQRFDADGVPQQIELTGTSGADRIDLGGSGDLQAVGGAGDDTYVVNGAGDRVIELPGEGSDTVEALGSVTLPANVEVLRLLDAGGAINGTGGAGNDVIYGNASANVLEGRGGNDTLHGGAGSDTASYAAAGAAVSVSLAQQGVAQNTGGGGSDLLTGFENLVGSGFADTLTGDAGANRIEGGTGNDTLAGGEGNDTLLGGAGAGDTAVFAGNSAEYRFGWLANGQVTVQRLVPDTNGDGQPDPGAEGTDVLHGIETLRFADRDVALPAGGETAVNTYTASYQYRPAVAVLANGTHVIAWESWAQDGSGYGIHAQRFAISGAPLGGEFRVNTHTPSDQGGAAIAALGGGGFVVTWTSWAQDGGGWGVYAQRYSAAGVAEGAEFRVNTTTANSQYGPAITALAAGGFVIAWTDDALDGNGAAVVAQRYDANGVALGTEFRVNTTTASFQGTPALLALAGGGFVVSWESSGQDGAGYGIYAQRYSAAGAALGAEFAVHTTVAGDQEYGSGAGLEGGGFVIAWSSLAQDGSGWGVYAQRFAANGTAQGGEFRVNTTTVGDQLRPSVAALGGGGFVVTWERDNDGSGWGVYAQRYDASGVALGGEIRVNTTVSSTQTSARVDALPDGGFVVTWESWSQDGDGYGVFSQRFDAAGNPRLVELAGTAGDDTIDLGGAGDLQGAGGAGDDTYVVNGPGDRVIEAADGGDDTVQALVSYTLGPVSQNLENLTLIGTAPINATGNDGPNVLTGNDQANILKGGAGDDLLYGRGGTDIAAYDGLASDFLVEQNPGFVVITDANAADGDSGTDILVGVETLRFTDQDLAITDVSVIGEFDINTTTIGNQTLPDLARQAGGGFVAVWQGPDGAGTGIWLQRFEAARIEGDQLTMGAAIGVELRVNASTAGDQANPRVVTLAGGNIVVVWETGAAGARDLRAQVFDASGVAQGGEITVNTTTASEQRNASIAALSTGGFAIAWESNAAGQDGSSFGIVARSFDAAGAAASPEFAVNTTTTNAQLAPVVSALAGGAFVVAWESAGGDGNGYGVLARRFASPTDTSGTEIAINTTTAGDQRAPAIATLTNGNFVVAWESADAGGTGIFAQLFNAAGTAVGSQFAVNTTTALDQSDPQVAALTSGGFVVSWSSTGQDGSGASVHAQRYNGSGAAQGGEFRVNTTTVNAQNAAAVAALDGGNFVIAWQSNGQDGGGYGIFGKGFRGDGTPAVPPIIGTDGDDVLDLTIGDVAAYGLKGHDLYIVDSTGDVVIEQADEGTDTVQASISWSLGSNVENLQMVGGAAIGGTGNAANNTMTGNSGANTLRGNDGNDSLDGGEGNDLIFGGAQGDPNSDATGDDTLDGGIGADTMEGGLGSDTYYVDDVNDLIRNEQADTGPFGGGVSAAMLAWGAGAPRPAAVGGDIDTVISQVSYTLQQNIENLELEGGENLSGAGNELDNLLAGNVGDNLLRGLDGIDVLDGGAGDDTLDGGAGADTLGGGLDDDTYVVDADDTILEFAGEGSDTVQAAMHWTLATHLENLVLSGAAALRGTGNLAANALTGNGGNNTLNGAGGDDTLDGGAGADSMIGGIGNDTFVVDSLADVVREEAGGGTDTVLTSIAIAVPAYVEIVQLTGGADIALTGNALANRLYGNAGANTLNGGGGADTLAGGAGNDVYISDGLDQILELGGEGFDTVRSGASHTLGAELENLVLTGAAAIAGTGNGLANEITGNGGANTLRGAGGADTLRGGGGNDTYQIDAEDTVVEAANGGTDTIATGFSFTLGPNLENLTLTGIAAISGTGNDAGNVLTGNDADNLLDGGAGIDTLAGGKGADSYRVTAGDVIVEAPGEGADTVYSSTGWVLAANVERLVLEGGANVSGIGNESANTLDGNDGANSLAGGGGNDTLNGGAGNDTLRGGTGADLLAGGAGNDTYQADATDTLAEDADAGTDTVEIAASHTLGANLEHLVLGGAAALNGTGNALANRLSGNTGANSLAGGGGADTLEGGEGNDTLAGGVGADVLAGGAGDDLYRIDADDTFTELAGGGLDTIVAGFSLTLAAQFENLTLTGSQALDATGNAASNLLTGNDGANVLDGKAGVDTMQGGRGADTYFVTAGDVVIENTGEGADTVIASIAWTLGTSLEHLELRGTAAIAGTGNALANRISGNTAANTLDGGGGIDTLLGGAGNDVYLVTAGDVVTELAGEGRDTVRSALSWTLGAQLENLVLTGAGNAAGTGNGKANLISGNDGNNRVAGGSGNDTLGGSAGADSLDGGGGRDSLTGGIGNDTLLGGAGGDTLRGSGGNDRLTGNAGADRFVFDVAPDAAGNLDTVTDFLSGTDRIQLSAAVFGALEAGVAIDAAQFHAAAGASAGTTAAHRLVYDTASGALYYDADGDGAVAAVQFAQLTGAPVLAATDFTVIG